MNLKMMLCSDLGTKILCWTLNIMFCVKICFDCWKVPRGRL